MTAATLTITDFLLARITEDEAWAKEALSFSSLYDQESLTWHWIAGHRDGSRLTPTSYTPARVLAECEAKRRIVEEWAPIIDHVASTGGGGYMRRALRCLALPHADHPDYRDEWRP